MNFDSLAASIPNQLLSKRPAPPLTPGQADGLALRGNTELHSILVVDDEQEIADSLSEILQNHGYVALPVYDGHSAVQAARQRCPDLVICDVVMPRMNGVQTALAIRKVCPRARVFLFSGQAVTVDLLDEARQQGHSFELLPKPIHPDQLLKALASPRKA